MLRRWAMRGACAAVGRSSRECRGAKVVSSSTPDSGRSQRWAREGALRHFSRDGRSTLTLVDPLAHAGIEEVHGGHLMAPMSGLVVAVMVKAGQTVAKGAPLMILEAMKMEHTIAAPGAGIVKAVNCAAGDRVKEGADLVELDEA